MCGFIYSVCSQLWVCPGGHTCMYTPMYSCISKHVCLCNISTGELLLPIVRSLQNGNICVLHISGLMLSSDPVYEAFFSSFWHSPISELSLEFGVTETLVTKCDLTV